MSDEQPADNRNILQKAGALAKDSLSIFGWSIYYSLSQVTHEFRCYKFGPMNVFMRNSPEFRTTLSKMDEYYEKNARNHGTFPDWPIINIFNDMRALYYQMCFMKGQDRYFSKLHQFAWSAEANASARKGYDPQNPIYGWLVAYWDRCQLFHIGADAHYAETRVADKYMADNQHANRHYRNEWQQNKEFAAGDGIFFPQMGGIKPKLLKCEDFGWHNNGNLYPMEVSSYAFPDVGLYKDKEQYEKALGKFYAYKDNHFEKKLYGHGTTADLWMTPGKTYGPAVASHE